MKRFLKRRWHGIPIGIVSIVLALVLVGGGVFAWYQVATGTAEVTVEECISYEVTGGDGSFDAGTSVWTVLIYPGETKILYLTVYNASSAALEVVANVEPPSEEGLTVTVSEPVTISGNSSGSFSIEVHAAGDVEPTVTTFEFTLNRR